MPRDGSGIFSKPFPDAVAGTTIESAVHNGIVADFTTDANAARPIVAGGTGANNVTQARTNLKIEVRGAQVTNYDSHVWEAGSFWSAEGATGAPVAATGFVGICYIYEGSAGWKVLEARNLHDTFQPARLYIREQRDSIWSAWKIEGTDIFVDSAGDQMTGNLTINKSIPELVLNRADAASALISGKKLDLARWAIIPGNSDAETSGNTGSNFDIARYDDAGAFLGYALRINRQTGIVTLSGAITTNQDLTIQKSTPVLILDKGITASEHAGIFGKKSGLTRWLVSVGDITNEAGANSGSDFSIYRYNDAGVVFSSGAPCMKISRATSQTDFIGNVAAAGNLTSTNGFVMSAAAGVAHLVAVDTTWGGAPGGGVGWRNAAGTFYAAKTSNTGTPVENWLNIQSTGMVLMVGNAYKPGGGAWLDSSDARIKDVLGDYTHGLAELRQVNPVRYKFKGNYSQRMPEPESATATHAEITQREFVGVVAQEIEGPLPETVAQAPGYIDGQQVSDVRIYDSSALIYTLINAVKELAARVEALEGAQATP